MTIVLLFVAALMLVTYREPLGACTPSSPTVTPAPSNANVHGNMNASEHANMNMGNKNAKAKKTP